MKRFGPIFIILAASLWGVDGIVFRPALNTLPVPLVVFTESTLISVLLFPLFLKYRHEIKNLSKSDFGTFFLIALFGGALGTMAITKALFYVNYVNLSIVILIQKLQPLFAISLAALILKEKLSGEFFIYAAVAIIGSYFLTFGFSVPVFSFENKTVIAVLYSFVAAFSFGLSTVLSKKAIQKVSFFSATILRFYFTAIIMLVVLTFTWEFDAFSLITGKQFLIFLAIAFSTGGVAIILYYIGLQYVSASESTILELAFPVTAVFLEYFLHGNMLSLAQWFGAILLVGAIYKITKIYNK